MEWNNQGSGKCLYFENKYTLYNTYFRDEKYFGFFIFYLFKAKETAENIFNLIGRFLLIQNRIVYFVFFKYTWNWKNVHTI